MTTDKVQTVMVTSHPVKVLNWFSLHLTVLALGYFLGGLKGVVIASICNELFKLVAAVLLEPKK